MPVFEIGGGQDEETEPILGRDEEGHEDSGWISSTKASFSRNVTSSLATVTANKSGTGKFLTLCIIFFVGILIYCYYSSFVSDVRISFQAGQEKSNLTDKSTYPLAAKTINSWLKFFAQKVNLVAADINANDGDFQIADGNNLNVKPLSILSGDVTCKCVVQTDINISDIYDKLDFTGDLVWSKKNSWKFRNYSQRKTDWRKSKKLKVFVVPHSHNDAGWGETFSQYYRDRTKNILNNMLRFMPNNTRRKFVWCEMSFFNLWWQSLHSEQREEVKRLVKTGRLEFIGGGWVMPDEASVHYFSHLTQLIEGHQWLHHHLEYHPRNGWAIDPFGLSMSLRYMNKESGLNRTVFLRTNYVLKEYLKSKKMIEFFWRQPWDSVGTTDVLCHMLPFGTYDTSGSCAPREFDNVCQMFHRLRQDQLKSVKSVHEIAGAYIEGIRETAKFFQTSNIMIPLGGDFAWQTYSEWKDKLSNFDVIINHINTHPEFNTQVQYATLNEYFEALEVDSDLQAPSFSGDFFTYADKREEYWSGYFTSRIFHKRTERQLMSLVRSAQLIYSLLAAELFRNFNTLEFPMLGDLLQRIVESRRNLSIFQHHDGITGTSADHVVDDYAEMMEAAIYHCEFVIQQALHVLTELPLLSQSAVATVNSENKFFISAIPRPLYLSSWDSKVLRVTPDHLISQLISVYNSLEVERIELVEIRTNTTNVEVLDRNMKKVPFEIVPVIEYRKINSWIPAATQSSFSGRDDMYIVYFLAKTPPLSVKIYFIARSNCTIQANVSFYNSHANLSDKFRNTFHAEVTSDLQKEIKLTNMHLSLTFLKNGTIGALASNGSTLKFGLKFLKYKSFESGLYVFSPFGHAMEINVAKPPMLLVRGKLFSYVQVWLPQVSYKVTLYSHEGLECHGIHVENTIDLTHDTDLELVMRFETAINSGANFYTDSNGLQMIRRKRRNKLPLPANFYPMATSAFIEDADTRLTLVAGQPGGVTSLKSGQLEVMLDRTMSRDDGKGIGQGSMDNVVTTSLFKILLETPSRIAQGNCGPGEYIPLMTVTSYLQMQSLLHPLLIFYSGKINPIAEEADYRVDYQISSCSKCIPCDIHLVSLSSLPYYVDSSTQDSNRTTIMHLGTDISIILHRVGLDPRFEPPRSLGDSCIPDPFSHTNYSGISVKSLLGDLLGNELQRTSLTFTHMKGEAVIANQPLILQPLQMYALQGKFSSERWKNSGLAQNLFVFNVREHLENPIETNSGWRIHRKRSRGRLPWVRSVLQSISQWY